MRKTRFLAMLLALLLLALPLIACGDDPAEDAPHGNEDQGTPPADGSGGKDDGSVQDPATDPGIFLAQNGYPLGFAVQFTMDGYGFDTASNSLPNGSDTVNYTFTAADYVDLYRCLDNTNFWLLPLDLTYSNLTGNSAAEGPGIQYTITVTTSEGTRTCYVDGAALSLLSADPDVSNAKSLVYNLSECLAMYRERVSS